MRSAETPTSFAAAMSPSRIRLCRPVQSWFLHAMSWSPKTSAVAGPSAPLRQHAQSDGHVTRQARGKYRKNCSPVRNSVFGTCRWYAEGIARSHAVAPRPAEETSRRRSCSEQPACSSRRSPAASSCVSSRWQWRTALCNSCTPPQPVTTSMPVDGRPSPSSSARRAILSRSANHATDPIDESLFDYQGKASVLYRMLVPKLNLDLSTEFRNSPPDNRFELWRLLNRKLGPPRADWAFHWTNDLRKHARTSCTDFGQTVKFSHRCLF